MDPPAVLGLVQALLDRLHDAEIDYCHWKSNQALHRSASGDNDLDLLVAAHDVERFEQILSELKFRHAIPPKAKRLPDIFDLFGLDTETGRLVHVHAHYQLVLGDDTTKNFRLPIEDAYLASATRQGLFRTPSVEFEYLVFVLRMGTKHCPFDSVVFRRGRLKQTEKCELVWLEDRIDRSRTERIRSEHIPEVSADLFADVRAAIDPDATVRQRIRAGRELLAALAPMGRRFPWHDLGLRLWRRVVNRIRKKLRVPKARKRLSPGRVIAIVGSDGSGKSTAVEHVAEALGTDLEVTRIHMGKPAPGLLSRFVKTPMRQLRRRGLLSSTRLAALVDFDERGFPGASFAVWHLMTARDRARTSRHAHRRARAGELVLSDRYPTPPISLMDGPRSQKMMTLPNRPHIRWLARREAHHYARIQPPDIVLVLAVDPAIAVTRRHDEDPGFVRTRAEEVAAADWDGVATRVIDANRAKAEVLADVRKSVWENL